MILNSVPGRALLVSVSASACSLHCHCSCTLTSLLGRKTRRESQLKTALPGMNTSVASGSERVTGHPGALMPELEPECGPVEEGRAREPAAAGSAERGAAPVQEVGHSGESTRGDTTAGATPEEAAEAGPYTRCPGQRVPIPAELMSSPACPFNRHATFSAIAPSV